MNHQSFQLRLNVLQLRATQERRPAEPVSELDAFYQGRVDDETFDIMRRRLEPSVKKELLERARWHRQAESHGFTVRDGTLVNENLLGVNTPMHLATTIIALSSDDPRAVEAWATFQRLELDPRHGALTKDRSTRIALWMSARVLGQLLHDQEAQLRAELARMPDLEAWNPNMYRGEFVFANPPTGEDTSGHNRTRSHQDG